MDNIWGLTEELEWQFHTTMTYDLAYEAALYNMCKNIAIYYDGAKCKEDEIPGRNTCSRTVNPELIPLVKKTCYSVQCKNQRFHAKISLLKYKNGKYRFVVWSKNHGFTADACADIGVAFDLNLECPKELEAKKLSERNGVELKSYFKKIYSNCENSNGKSWLVDRGIMRCNGECTRLFDHVTLSYGSYKNTVLFFGGCDEDPDSLAEKMKREIGARGFKPKIILTPPLFVSSSYKKDIIKIINNDESKYKEKLKEICKQINLYESKKDKNDSNKSKEENEEKYPAKSHIKLYLFDQYIFVGSANATKAGIGYDLLKNKELDAMPSVECLVGFNITSEISERIEEEIKKNYEVFDGTFQFTHNDNKLALYLMNHYEITKNTFKDKEGYDTTSKGKIQRMTFTFEKVKEDQKDVTFNGYSIKIVPIEYEFALDDNSLDLPLKDSFTISVSGFKKFQDLSGFMLIVAIDDKGKSKRYLWYTKIPNLLDCLKEEMFEVENVVKELFDCRDKAGIKKLQAQENYKDNQELAPFFNALLEEKSNV